MPSVHCISRKLLKKNGLERLPWDVGGATTEQQLQQVDATTDLQFQQQHRNYTKHIHELEAESSTTIDSNKKKLSVIVVDSSAAPQVSQPHQLNQEDANLTSKASPTKSVEETIGGESNNVRTSKKKKETKHMSPIAMRALAALNSDSDSSSEEEEDMEMDKPEQKGLDAAKIENLATEGKDEVGVDTSSSGHTQIIIPSLPPLPVVPSPGYNVADDTAQLDIAKLQKSGDDTLLSDMNTEEVMKNADIYQVCSLSDGEEDAKSTKEPAKKKRRVPEEKSKRIRVSFQQRLDELKAYKDLHGHTRVKKSEDKSLYEFCNNIRYAHNHPDKSTVVVNEERIAWLDALGFEWAVKEQFDILFEQRLEDLKAFKLKYGHLNVKRKEDPSLYNFCVNIRYARNGADGGMMLNKERISSLDAIGFEWGDQNQKTHKKASFQQRLDELKAFKLERGHLNVRKEDDPSLYNFCNSIRTSRNNTGKPGTKKLTEERIASLDALGFEWAAKERKRVSFLQRLEDLKAYKLKHGHLNVKRDDDPSLYNFCTNIRDARNNPSGNKMKVTEERIASLDALGFDWGKKKSSG